MHVGMLDGVPRVSIHVSSFFSLFLILDNLNWTVSGFLILLCARIYSEPLYWNFHFSYTFQLQNFYLVHFYFYHFLEILYLDVASFSSLSIFLKACLKSLPNKSPVCLGFLQDSCYYCLFLLSVAHFLVLCIPFFFAESWTF